MTSNELKRWQLVRIRGSIAPSLEYLHRLRDRMHKVGFPDADPLWLMVNRVRDDLFTLDILLQELIFEHAGNQQQQEVPKGETRLEQLAKWDRIERERRKQQSR